jgi:hypothetical protein
MLVGVDISTIWSVRITRGKSFTYKRDGMETIPTSFRRNNIDNDNGVKRSPVYHNLRSIDQTLVRGITIVIADEGKHLHLLIRRDRTSKINKQGKQTQSSSSYWSSSYIIHWQRCLALTTMVDDDDEQQASLPSKWTNAMGMNNPWITACTSSTVVLRRTYRVHRHRALGTKNRRMKKTLQSGTSNLPSTVEDTKYALPAPAAGKMLLLATL